MVNSMVPSSGLQRPLSSVAALAPLSVVAGPAASFLRLSRIRGLRDDHFLNLNQRRSILHSTFSNTFTRSYFPHKYDANVRSSLNSSSFQFPSYCTSYPDFFQSQSRSLFTTSRPLLKTHYERLGVSSTATAKEIKQAYFKLAKDCHPDLHGDKNTKEFQELSAAYSVLSDANKRSAYDASGYQDRNYDAPAGQGYDGQYGAQQGPPDMDAARQMFSDLFNELGISWYFTELEREVREACSNAANPPPEKDLKFDLAPLVDLAKRRKGLMIGIVVPSMIIFRHPAIAIAALRVLGGIGMFAFQIVARNPALQKMIGAYLWKKIVEMGAKMSDGPDENSKSNQNQQSKGAGARKKR